MAKKGVAADPTLIPYQIIFEEWVGISDPLRGGLRFRTTRTWRC